MVVFKHFVFFVIFTTTYLLPSVLGVKCYVCNSSDDPKGCGHGTDLKTKYFKDCDKEPKNDGVRFIACKKIVTWNEYTSNKSEAEKITRKCSNKRPEAGEVCEYRGGFIGGGKRVECNCDFDACNSGILTIAMKLFVGAASAFLLLF